LEAGEPTLVFAHHHKVFDMLNTLLHAHRLVSITGREDDKAKMGNQGGVPRGQTNLCFIALRSATGIDGLQDRARVVVFAELDWSRAIHSQAEDRAHRDVQKDSVLCHYLVSTRPDPEMQEALGLKVSQFLGLMEEEGEREEDQALNASAAKDHMRR
jgi:SWI/SNF-related matrix-associated actin-dependent regulator of chromatin subfamily A-like protein 1